MKDDLRGPDPLASIAALFHSATHTGAQGSVVIQLLGELDTYSAPVLDRDIASALEAKPERISLDLSKLTFLDSTGIRVLLAAHRRADAQGCAFILHSPQRSVMKVLKLTGVDRLLGITSGDAEG